MSLLEDHSASFIVRIWREQGDGLGMCQEWRGSIEHVQSGQRRFFRDLSAIAKFMQPHLEQIGVDASMRFWDVMTTDLFDSPPPGKHVVDTAPKSLARQRRKR